MTPTFIRWNKCTIHSAITATKQNARKKHQDLKKDKSPWRETVTNIRPVECFMTVTEFLIISASSEAVKRADKGSTNPRRTRQSCSDLSTCCQANGSSVSRGFSGVASLSQKMTKSAPILICRLQKSSSSDGGAEVRWWRWGGRNARLLTLTLRIRHQKVTN